MANYPRKKKTLGHFKYGSVLFSTTLSLFIVGLFGVILIQAKTLTSLIRENVEVQIFLDKNLKAEEITAVKNNLASRPFVLIKSDTVSLRYISNEDAAKTFIESTGEDFTQFLEDNPLRDSYVITISEEFQTADQLESIAKELEAIPGVFEVSYMTDLVESINKNLVKVSLVMGGFILILIITVVMLINNTIRLALFSQRFLIRSMQLVGATRAFIRKPFLMRSWVFGMLAGAFASLILFGLISYTQTAIEGFALLQNQELMLILFGILVVVGGILSVLSTLRAVNKYLNMTLDELY
ncbi:cell division protein FtsX [Algoriphagus zhangzhouensis]|uniref:Cell division protein FtsX n=1 Tax=Algoriphagus zhangzhouensis TaxID=1073327 RepID=A0A1M7Z5M4_9BACT|nr:permease-like cell division protein FtsX [Algoriphagus zhangzhouensis]TDY48896.1 cell division transport system permease protein [Algoriphagus zhangzhouensis]SHO60122.1 cell division transport system permease protein [Algoriphagus zhangzhouensis]